MSDDENRTDPRRLDELAERAADDVAALAHRYSGGKRIMRRTIVVIGVAVASTVASFAGADPVGQYPPPRDALVRALGSRWEVTSATGALEAHRASPQAPTPDFAARLDAAARELRQRGGGITVDIAQTSVHLAGMASDCDSVVSAAQRFAAISGVNALVIDTTCRPRD